MFSEVIKRWRLSALASVAVMMALGACNGGGTSAEQASLLLERAEACGKSGRFEEGLAFLDSIDRTYPSAVDVRREAMKLRPLLTEQLVNRQLQAADSLSAVTAYRIDSLSKNLQTVRNPIENYFVARSEGAVDVGSVAGLHGRMAPDGRFYLVATSPKSVGTTTITVSAGGESASTKPVPYDGERNDRSSGRDVITFVEGECHEVGQLISDHRLEPVAVTFSGSGSASMTLSDSQREAIASIFELSSLIRAQKKNEIEKQRLSRLLDAARSQVARTAAMTDSLEN